MFRETLRVHWVTLRWPLAALGVLAFALPLLATLPDAAVMAALPTDVSTRLWLQTARDPLADWDVLFPLLAITVGMVAGLGVWYWDHRQDHVLALSLPLPRSRYVLVKYAAGAALCLPVVALFLVGAVIAGAALELPEFLHARPVALGLRFSLAVLVVYSMGFALAAGTIPTAMKFVLGVSVLTFLVILLLLTPLLPTVFDPSFADLGLRIVELAGRMLYEWPGPFAILGGEWSLIGV